MGGVRDSPNENYTMSEMATLSWEMLKEEWYERGPTKNFLGDFHQDIAKYGQLTQQEVIAVVIVAVLFTIHRFLLTKLFLNPLSKYIGFQQKEVGKLSESSCKLFYYGCLYAFEYYLVVHKYSELRNDISSHWRGLTLQSEVPSDILLLYVIQAGFYFHSIYATIFLDAWKKDSIAMLIHHVLANSLIIFSLILRYHRIGLVVLYLHDIADVVLETTKIVLCFKNKFPSIVLEILSGFGFLCFAFTWFWCRLVLYPQIVLFSTGYLSRTMLPDANFYFLFNVMLWALALLNVWWFHFIVALMVRIVLGQVNTVDDTREYDDNDKKLAKSNGHTSNVSSASGKKQKARLR